MRSNTKQEVPPEVMALLARKTQLELDAERLDKQIEFAERVLRPERWKVYRDLVEIDWQLKDAESPKLLKWAQTTYERGNPLRSPLRLDPHHRRGIRRLRL